MNIIIKNGNMTFKVSPNEITFDKLYNRTGDEVAYNELIDSEHDIYLRSGDGGEGIRAINHSVTNYENISGYKRFVYNGNFNTPSTGLGIVCFYDSSKNYLCCYGTRENESEDRFIEVWESTNGTKNGTVPEGATYMRSMNYSHGTTTPFSITFYKN